MAKTFSLRRKDVIQKPLVIDLNARWPALLEYSQIEEEFRRITLKPLQSTFFGKLDENTPKLLRLYRRKGGAVGKKLDETLEIMNEDNSIESRRESVIRGLILYLGEKTEELIKDYRVKKLYFFTIFQNCSLPEISRSARCQGALLETPGQKRRARKEMFAPPRRKPRRRRSTRRQMAAQALGAHQAQRHSPRCPKSAPRH
ncbi:uncharacterized protein LOC127946922 [Carassius gibelio]|uniref:uncharacterized protein LOC127946922 n=1 Tax=Carassius gibelio TaxID=101364 RepID=UPI0022780FC0|nr:uncharacterized protein LOC127946922 [Carassius gibelio]